MDCHFNCHGELNLLLWSLPFVSLIVLRMRQRIGTLWQRLWRKA